MAKRVFLIILDSFGCGNAPDANEFGDEGSNTLAAVLSDSDRPFPNLSKMGLLDIDGQDDPRIVEYKSKQTRINAPIGTYGMLREASKGGKDSTIGHWEIAGVISADPQPTFPDGFPKEVVDELEKVSGRKVLCNKPYSGTEVIKDYGKEHMETGALILYTSADSVLQIAAHEEVVPLNELYDICRKMRAYMTGKLAVGRIIARPFIGTPGNFTRTDNRHDFSVEAPGSTMLDVLKQHGLDVISVGKINDLFAGRGITESNPTQGNTDGINKTLEFMDRDFNGLCFVNLVDFDMKYGHRNNIHGYAEAMHEFDDALATILEKLRDDDLLILTADHGCDPSTPSTDHSRENIPLLIYGDGFRTPHNLGELVGFDHISDIVMTALLKNDFPKTFPDYTPSEDLMGKVDLTNLKTTATEDDIKNLIDRAINLKTASVCIQPSYVRLAAEYAKGRIPICTVIGFPNGYQTAAVKVFEAEDAIDNGAKEIDMVINRADLKSGKTDAVRAEVTAIADAVHRKGGILKVIIETCELTEEEKLIMCDITSESGADFIKTSTGFGSKGAQIEDIELMRKALPSTVKIKAAGGIRDRQTAEAMLSAGADRIGASSL